MHTALTLFALGRGHRRVWRAFLATTALTAATLLSGLFATARAYGWESDRAAGGSLVEVQLLVRGNPAPLYLRSGQWDRWYFEAFRGRDYALRLRNTTGERIGVLISVDGLNVVNGERSRLRSNEPMYVLDPWESATIRGWRSSLDDVRKFVFVDEERSYASRTDQANGDMGWIRVLAFREHRPQAWLNWGRTKSLYRGGAPAPGAPQAEEKAGGADERAGRVESGARDMARMAPQEQESSPGTGWGEQRYDPVRRVWFQPEGSATDRLAFRYEYASGLRALGIFPRHRNRLWERERGELGFAQPPKW